MIEWSPQSRFWRDDGLAVVRQTITNPPDGKPTDRPTGLARHESFREVTIDFANATTGIVVDG